MRIIIERENPAAVAAEEFVKMADKYKNAPRLFMFSGGSALEIVKHLPENFFTTGDTATVLDERYTFNEVNSNFAALSKLLSVGCSTIDTRPIEGESLEDAAVRFEKKLRKWKDNNHGGKIIITQGVGEDGHTAGILPFPKDEGKFLEIFEGNDRWVVGYKALFGQSPHSERITVNINFLMNMVCESLVYVTGDNKKDILAKALGGKGVLAKMPALVVHRMKKVTIMTNINPDW